MTTNSGDVMPPTILGAFGRLRRAVRNWYSVGVLATIVMPTRVPPRGGLRNSWLGRHAVTFRLSDASRIRCRLQDAGDLISVYVDNDYGRFDVNWDQLDRVVDVGSTTGAFTIWAANQARRAKFVAVEPNPELVPYLRQNVSRNGLDTRVTIVEAALGAAPGTAQLEDNRELSTLMRVVPLGKGTGYAVRVVTLQQVLAQMDAPGCDLLKIDCEGGEYDILLSASDDALRRVSAVICEYHPSAEHRREELVARLTDSGFDVYSDEMPLGFIHATRSLRN